MCIKDSLKDIKSYNQDFKFKISKLNNKGHIFKRMEYTNLSFIVISQTIAETAAVICLIIFVIMSIFQLLLAFGAPLGNLAWGGKYKILPFSLRIGSFISALIFLFAGIVILEKANFITIINSSGFVSTFTWFFTGLFGLSCVGNLMSKSIWEKRIMFPIALILFILCLIVAIGD